MSYLRDAISGLFGDVPWTEAEPELMNGDVLSDILPWRVYDEEDRFYHLSHGAGFLMEVGATVGNDDVFDNIKGVVASSLPEQAMLQILNWTSPGIGLLLKQWSDGRSGTTPLLDEMARRRVAHLAGLRFGSDWNGARATPFNRRVFIAVWLPGDLGVEDTKRLHALRNALKNAFEGTSWSDDVDPSSFLRFVREILHVSQSGYESGAVSTRDVGTVSGSGSDTPTSRPVRDIMGSTFRGDWALGAYDPYMPLNFQVPGGSLRVTSEAIELAGSPEMSASVSSVNSYPREWVSGMGQNLWGRADRLMDRPLGPVLTSFVLRAMSPEKAGSFLLKKRGASEHAANSSFGKYIPNFAEKRAELDSLSAEINAGEKLFETIYTVVSYAKGNRTDADLAAAEMESIYRRQEIKLTKDRFLQLPLFLASLPFGCSHKMLDDFGRQMRMVLLKSAAAMTLLPIHGEWSGHGMASGLALLGRQGQLFGFDNFKSSGNYNVAVVGKSGGGKSVFMQELSSGIFAAGGRVLVIDDGYSFAATAEVLGGKLITFAGENDIRLNPFSLLDAGAMGLDEYRGEAIELITRIVATMADLSDFKAGRVEGVEEDFIRAAISQVWDNKGPTGEISDVRDALSLAASQDDRLPDVVRKLDAYSRGGSYGHYFEGEANITLDAAFTVVELSDIKGQAGLEATILQIVMFLGTELMFKTDRSTPVAIVIDEAWDLLRGPSFAPFIEGVVRRARKYTGALVTGTQSMRDYDANPAAKVCIENSDYRVFLAQKPDSVDALQSVDSPTKMLLKTITSVPGRFAEMAIQMPEGVVFGRLLLDPFSLGVFSSKGATVQRRKAYEAEGLTTVEAVARMVERSEVV